MADQTDSLAVALFSEVFMADQLARSRVGRALPKGMELSHFSVLNHLANAAYERSPAQLADTFHVTRGAMTNTLAKLEWAGHVHVRPDWDDARRIEVAPDGTFEILLAAERPAGHRGNFMAMPPGTQYFCVRQYFVDWENERPARFDINRIR